MFLEKKKEEANLTTRLLLTDEKLFFKLKAIQFIVMIAFRFLRKFLIRSQFRIV